MKHITILGDQPELSKILTKYFTPSEDIQIRTITSPPEKQDMDVLFWDADLCQLEDLKEMREKHFDAPVVVMSESEQYAVESYEVEAAGYLLKPFQQRKVEDTMRRIFPVYLKRRIPVRSKRSIRYPYLDNILYAESNKHQTFLHMADGEQIVTTEKLSEIQGKIPDGLFLRCHNSYLVNRKHVADVKEGFVLSDGTQVPIPIKRRQEILEKYRKT